MNYNDIMKEARDNIGSYCKVCKVCNGVACRNQIPGPGAKGTGDVAIRNYQKWQEIRINMDTIHENAPVDTSFMLFDRKFRYPIFAGPMGTVKGHYGDKYDNVTYNKILLKGCAKAGIAAFTGDGADGKVMEGVVETLREIDGAGVPTIKPWKLDMVRERMELVKESGAFAAAMDVDAVGLPFMKNMISLAGSKSVEDLSAIKEMVHVPFIVKGIMTRKGAQKAKEAGASAIVVSNHGGRVLDQCPATAEVLDDIVAAVGNSMKILVDGGIRSGADVFKAIAMGADGVIIARPFAAAVYGGGEDGVRCYVEKIGAELEDTMAMCGAFSLNEISRDMIWKR